MTPIRTALAAAGLLLLGACAPDADEAAATRAEADEQAQVPAAAAPAITVHRTATCGCCGKWEDHLREAGFTVASEIHRDMRPVRHELGVPEALASCHTGVVDGYAVEGHVPAAAVKALLAERPDVRGLAVPGMPIGSPGMEYPGVRGEAFDVLLVQDDGSAETFYRHTP